MSTLVNLPSQTFAVRVASFPVTVPGGATRIRVTLVCDGAWPAGLVAKAGVAWANGNNGYAWLYGGGKAGPVVTEVGVPAGVTTGTVNVDVQQAVASTLLVEAV